MNPLALEQQVCFALYSASRAVTAAYRPLLAPLGVTYPQYLVLLVLWEHGTRSVRDLGEALHLDSGTLSPLLKRLEASGLVTRARAAEDERQVRVGLTDAGWELRERAVEIPAQLHDATGVDDETLAALHRACHALIEESQR
ncbi:MarR family winged helix-turn-helix transcriptional regulator [Solirubrobacter deserti]|uniref:MarR family transcriptional regulator n=1 Tax=Solirubrobacter deserti TaxID=2282478 RepID=A0ABT4RDN5_9ACTN|nr:MarR family transcriptional regulator [Solirubrobacter deserti]MDA0136646.1 MarR family transcriptional regulator [Solirubrobacter deserti]